MILQLLLIDSICYWSLLMKPQPEALCLYGVITFCNAFSEVIRKCNNPLETQNLISVASEKLSQNMIIPYPCNAWLEVIIQCNNPISRVSSQKGPTRQTYACQIGPFWQDTLDINIMPEFCWSLSILYVSSTCVLACHKAAQVKKMTERLGVAAT